MTASQETTADPHPAGPAQSRRGAPMARGRRPSAELLRDHPSLLAPTGRLGRAVCVFLMLLTALGAIAVLVVARLTALPADAVLRVGDVTVTDADFQRRVGVLVGLYGAQVPPDGPDRGRFDRDAAQAVATSVVLDRVAAERNLVAPEQDARQALDQVVAANFNGDRQAFVRSLGALRVSEQDVLGEIRRQQTTTRVVGAVTTGVPPASDADVAAVYTARRGEMVIPERRRLRNIVVDNPDRARVLADQARAGADVAALASSSSLDRSTVPAGGDLGFVAAAQLEQPVAAAAFAVPSNGIYGPVQSRFGWNVGQVVEIQPVQPQSVDQVREPLRTQLTNQGKADRWYRWLTDQVRAADIQYADRYRPANPDVLPPIGTG